MSEFKTARLRDTSGRLIGTTAQVRQAVLDKPIYMSCTRFSDIPNLSVTITPYSNTSKILIMVSVALSVNGHGGIRVIRDANFGQDDRSGVEIGSGGLLGTNALEAYRNYKTATSSTSIPGASDRSQVFDWAYGTPSYNTVYTRKRQGGYWIDTPETTSVLSYKLQYANPYSSSYYGGINHTGYNYDNSSWNAVNVSTLTVIELMDE